jgi:regulator of ribonuclease activity B
MPEDRRTHRNSSIFVKVGIFVGSLAVLGLSGLIALGVGLWFGGPLIKQALQPAYDTLQTNPGESDDKNDEAVLAKLRANGSDLTKRTDIVFYLYIPALRDARAAASTLQRDGFTSQVQEPLGRLSDGSYESRYSVIAHMEEVPSIENLRENRALYKHLARRYKGEYDGWEAAVAR